MATHPPAPPGAGVHREESRTQLMSDHSQLAKTGAGGALVIGGTVVTGWWLLAIAASVVLVGALAVRFTFRAGRSASQR